jgi:hypothetical protein
MGNSSLTASIHILDDDSLLNVFHLYRPHLLGEDGDEGDRRIGGGMDGTAGGGGINFRMFARDGKE